jgi:hypothetical protein
LLMPNTTWPENAPALPLGARIADQVEPLPAIRNELDLLSSQRSA